jgi:hypothetical protein
MENFIHPASLKGQGQNKLDKRRTTHDSHFLDFFFVGLSSLESLSWGFFFDIGFLLLGLETFFFSKAVSVSL